MTSPARPENTGSENTANWSFARRPFWLFSHVFAFAVVALFVNLGLWQLSRHAERQAANAELSARLTSEPVVVEEAADLGGLPSLLDYRPATVWGTFIDGDFVRVVNRSQGGVAGEHVVGLMELADGSLVAVNRGFVPANTDVTVDPAPTGRVPVEGWLRESIQRGRFGADDTGDGALVPRMNTDDLAARAGRAVAPVWLQQTGGADDSTSATFPDPVPAPELDDGPHLGYAAQWFVFATLGVLFYGALLRRQSRSR